MIHQIMALNPITELGPSNPIYPFILLSKYRILVCQTCQYTYLAREITTHLTKKHPGIDLGTRCKLVEDTKIVPNMLQSQVELPQLQYPPPTTEPIPYLAPPKPNVLQCRQCGLNIRQLQAMQKHCTESYGWVNPRGKGRPSIGYPTTDPLPWIEGITCQRFFPSREGSKWFQVKIQTKGRVDRSKTLQ
jgi:hypothetical protein